MKLIPRTRGGALWRFAAAAAIVIGFTAATTAVAGLLQVKQIIDDLNGSPSLKGVTVDLPPAGAPQTILLIGSDHRAGVPYTQSNTDTMMLVRIDDRSSTINVLSIPRDLKVQINGATQKLNAAYSEGGVSLLLNTMRQQVFQGIKVNHVVDINFSGFSDLVDAIGCVYADVDHRYYNNTAQTNYSSIDIQSGYQKLCGDNQADTGALAFVRFRHTDSDLVRNARQQDFIRWAKDQYGIDKLIANKGKLLKIFGLNARTDHSLHTTDGLLNLFDLVLNADGHELKSIVFPAILQTCGAVGIGGAQTPCYVTAEAAAEQTAYKAFMTPTVPHAKSSTHKRKRADTSSTAGLEADEVDGLNQGRTLGNLDFPIYYPKLILSGTQYCSSLTGNCDEEPNPAYEYTGSYPRGYRIHGFGGASYPAYRMTLVINSALGEYYGVQGTTWQDAPILDKPTEVKTVKGKRLAIYFNGGRISLVAWRTPQAVYWISNSLSDSIGNGQLIAIAASLTRVH